MIKLRLVCNECGSSIEFKDAYYGSNHDEKFVTISTQQRYICLECGKDMELIVVKIESETKETIVGE